MAKKDDWRPKLTKIDDPIAEGDLDYRKWNGRRGTFHVLVGRPTPLPKQDYYVPLQMKGCFKGVKPIYGVGPIDSLMNAMRVVSQYDRYLNGEDKKFTGWDPPTLRRWTGKRRRARAKP